MSATATISLVVALAILTVVGLVGHRLRGDRREERRRGLNRKATAADRRVAAAVRFRKMRKGEVLAGTHDLSLTLLFAVTYLLSPLLNLERLFAATAVYVAANALVFIVSRNFEQGMLLVPWVSRLTIVVMGGLTLWLLDETFIKMNRTVYFGILAAWSVGSVIIGSPRLQRFGWKESLRGVTPEGWRTLTLFAGCACAMLAGVNELVWRTASTGFWVAFQVWGWVLAELVILPFTLPLFRRLGAPSKGFETGGAEARQ